MTLQELRQSYQRGELSKPEFIERAGAAHALLWAHASALRGTNVARIEIQETGLCIHFREPPISLTCAEGDTRCAPIEALNFGDYEAAELQMLRRLLALLNLEQPAFIDVGANIGFYSIALAKYFPNLTGLAFEPIPQTFALLQQNVALNRLTRFECHNLGLSDHAGELEFWTYPSLSAAASSARLLDLPDAQLVACPVQTLDGFLSMHPHRVDLLKCDVEGAELFVFKGAEATLRQHQPLIFSEMLRKWSARFHYHPNDIIAFLGALGYDCCTLAEQGLKRCPQVDEATRETNFIFLHRDKHHELGQVLLQPNPGA